MHYNKKNLEEFSKNLELIELNKYKILFLYGDLGVGKTQLVKFLLNNINVTSPTFTIYNNYEKDNINYYHFDLYRLKDNEIPDVKQTILEFYLNNNILFIEWSEKLDDKFLLFFKNDGAKIFLEKEIFQVLPI